ncbi:MAG: HD domain-containing protein [Actinomycetota bacterium]
MGGWIIVTAAALTVVLLAWGPGIVNLRRDLIFLVFVFMGEFLGISLPGGRSTAASLTFSLGFLLLPDRPSLGEVAAVALVAGMAAALVRSRTQGWRGLVDPARRALLLLAAAAAVQGVLGEIKVLPLGPDRISALTVIGAVAVFLSADVCWRAVEEALPRSIPVLPRVADALKVLGPPYAALGAMGSLVALSYPTLGIWTLVLFLVPLFATRYSLERFSWIRTTYLQTIRTLSGLPEMSGYSEPGHSRRVAELSGEIARELGLSSADDLECAALMHDLGRLSLQEPAPSASQATPEQRRAVALVGAEIAGRSGHLHDVANFVRLSAEPYRQHTEGDDPAVPLEARIIKTASAFDDLVRPGGPGLTPWDALARLHGDMAFEHDPRVVRVLTRTIEKRGRGVTSRPARTSG